MQIAYRPLSSVIDQKRLTYGEMLTKLNGYLLEMMGVAADKPITIHMLEILPVNNLERSSGCADRYATWGQKTRCCGMVTTLAGSEEPADETRRFYNRLGFSTQVWGRSGAYGQRARKTLTEAVIDQLRERLPDDPAAQRGGQGRRDDPHTAGRAERADIEFPPGI